MKNKFSQIRLLAILIISLCTVLPALAYDYCVDGIYYNKIGDNQVEVTYFYKPSFGDNYYRGDVVIPEKITVDGTEYTVAAIGNEQTPKS